MFCLAMFLTKFRINVLTLHGDTWTGRWMGPLRSSTRPAFLPQISDNPAPVPTVTSCVAETRPPPPSSARSKFFPRPTFRQTPSSDSVRHFSPSRPRPATLVTHSSYRSSSSLHPDCRLVPHPNPAPAFLPKPSTPRLLQLPIQPPPEWPYWCILGYSYIYHWWRHSNNGSVIF